ncbi:hypothetical protein FOZ60_008687 [Perkinsus olseni]|uniref:Rab-GAP TBC domain-containing protein n=1 Tax=Perkinsus olseni TaxID=32597 RepID=A0A7J6PDK8_PEROL|nr:hypothetical protein FOZ60_008687 [Perkinsus olseni]
MASSAGAVVALLSPESLESPTIEIELPVPARDSTSIGPRLSLASRAGPDIAVLVWGSQVFEVFPEASDLPTDIKCEPVAVSMRTGYHYALLQDGRVVTLGERPQPFLPLKDIVVDQLHAGTSFLLALSRAGDVYTWGLSLLGALGHGGASEVSTPGRVTLPGRARSAAVGPEHAVVLTDENGLYGWGNNYYGQVQADAPDVVPAPIPIQSVASLLCPRCSPTLACGSDHSVAMCACCSNTYQHFKKVLVWGGQRPRSAALQRIECPAECQLVGSLGSTSVVASPSGSYVVFDSSGKAGVIKGEHPKDGYRLSDLLMVPRYILFLYTVSAGGKHRCHTDDRQTDIRSFRPAHLPAKSWLERRRHQAQVAEVLEQGKLRRCRESSARDERQRALERLTEVWMKDFLPNYLPHRPVPYRMASMWRRHGLPPRARTALWPAAIGNPLRVTRSLYEMLVRKAKAEENRWLAAVNTMALAEDVSPSGRVEPGSFMAQLRAIDLDLPRTLPDLAVMCVPDGPLRQECRLVLSAFAMYRPDIGYVQGMSFLAAMLLLYMDPFGAFVCLASLLLSSPTLLGLYQLNVETNSRRFRIFMRLLRAHNPALHRHLTDIGISPDQFLPMWFLTLYSRPLTTESAALVWDLYLLDKEPVLYAAGIAILDILDERLRDRDFDECLMLLLRDTREIIGGDREAFLDAMNSVVIPDVTYSEIADLEAEFAAPPAMPNDRLFACATPS